MAFIDPAPMFCFTVRMQAVPIISWALCVLALSLSSAMAADDAALDRSLKPATADADSLPKVFRSIGVVQNKAMSKSGRFLVSSYLGMDFSDGPYSMYGANLDLGYAVSDFWEVYLNTTPKFINSQRSIVSKVESLELAGGRRATITAALPSRQFGLEVLWAPLYGKDSLGLERIIRSDTFVKAGIMQIQYEEGQGSGMKYQLGGGKTYFLGHSVGLRISATANYTQLITDGVKAFKMMAVLEGGIVLYL